MLLTRKPTRIFFGTHTDTWESLPWWGSQRLLGLQVEPAQFVGGRYYVFNWILGSCLVTHIRPRERWRQDHSEVHALDLCLLCPSTQVVVWGNLSILHFQQIFSCNRMRMWARSWVRAHVWCVCVGWWSWGDFLDSQVPLQRLLLTAAFPSPSHFSQSSLRVVKSLFHTDLQTHFWDVFGSLTTSSCFER